MKNLNLSIRFKIPCQKKINILRLIIGLLAIISVYLSSIPQWGQVSCLIIVCLMLFKSFLESHILKNGELMYGESGWNSFILNHKIPVKIHSGSVQFTGGVILKLTPKNRQQWPGFICFSVFKSQIFNFKQLKQYLNYIK